MLNSIQKLDKHKDKLWHDDGQRTDLHHIKITACNSKSNPWWYAVKYKLHRNIIAWILFYPIAACASGTARQIYMPYGSSSLQSPGYPYILPDYLSCNWIITTDPGQVCLRVCLSTYTVNRLSLVFLVRYSSILIGFWMPDCLFANLFSIYIASVRNLCLSFCLANIPLLFRFGQ